MTMFPRFEGLRPQWWDGTNAELDTELERLKAEVDDATVDFDEAKLRLEVYASMVSLVVGEIERRKSEERRQALDDRIARHRRDQARGLMP